MYFSKLYERMVTLIFGVFISEFTRHGIAHCEENGLVPVHRIMPQVELVSEIQRRNKLEDINEITYAVVDRDGEFGPELPDRLFSAAESLRFRTFNVHLDEIDLAQLILLHHGVDRRCGVPDGLFVAVRYF